MSGRRNIIGLDLATKVGWCTGIPGACPRSGSFRLKAPSDDPAAALVALSRWLEKEIVADPPALVVKEAMLPLQAFRDKKNSSANVVLQTKLHGAVEQICWRVRIPCISVAVSTIRKHLLGRSNMGDSAATKAAVFARCQLLGHIPRGAPYDDDQGDAVAAWEYACAHHARRAPAELFMFNEVPA